jgi:hypothetical protein
MQVNVTKWRENARLARENWGEISKLARCNLKALTRNLSLSIAAGDLILLNGGWYVTHSGLLRLAGRRGCFSIRTNIEKDVSDPAASRWICKAIVFRSSKSKGFVGFGDADPSNVSSAVRGAELRIAETRAVNRALRKAYGIGICSVEEVGQTRNTDNSHSSGSEPPQIFHRNCKQGSHNGQPRLRDQLCVLIRQHNLDASLVKAYAADYCGTASLSDATRESIESFISHLSFGARENRDALICKLNSYANLEVAR